LGCLCKSPPLKRRDVSYFFEKKESKKLLNGEIEIRRTSISHIASFKYNCQNKLSKSPPISLLSPWWLIYPQRQYN